MSSSSNRVIRFPRTNACCETFAIEQDVQRIDSQSKVLFTLHVRVRNQSGREVTDITASLPLDRAFLLNGTFIDFTPSQVIVEVTEGTANPFYDGVEDTELLADPGPTLPPRSSMCFRILVCFESTKEVNYSTVTLSAGAVFTVCGTAMCLSRCQPAKCRVRPPTLEETTVKGSIKLKGTPLCDLPSGTPDIEVTKQLCPPSEEEPFDTEVNYVLNVQNTGTESLTDVTLTDTFDTAQLTFNGATPAETSVNTSTGTITWDNLQGTGTFLVPNQCIYVCISFTLPESCDSDVTFDASLVNSSNVSAVGSTSQTTVTDGPSSALSQSVTLACSSESS